MTFFPHKTMAPRMRRIALAASTALALSLATTASFAQPAGGMMGGGPGMHGMHGGASIEQMIPRALAEAKASLNLNTSQQVMWDNVVAQGKAARDAAQANRQKVKDALTAELAKAEPDLASVAAVADGVEQQNRTARKAVRDQWLALYATFTTEQKGVVRDLMQKRLARAEAFHQRMLERFRQQPGTTG